MQKYYYLDKNIVINEHKCYVLGVYDEPLENAQDFFRMFFKDETLEVTHYLGEEIPTVPVMNGDVVRPANPRELVELGFIALDDGAYIEGDNIVKVDSPSWQYMWNKDEKKWIPNPEMLRDGEYIEGEEIKSVVMPIDLVVPKWNKELKTWEDGATDEELKEYYFNKINTYKAEILEVGFDFNSHQQKCREKDLALLGNAIAANEDAQPFTTVPVTHWSFNDNDVVEMSLEELKKLRIAGATFVQAIFTVEAQLKASSPNVKLNKQDFISKINEMSDVKCFNEVM